MEKRAKRDALDFLLSNNFKSTVTILLSLLAIGLYVIFPSVPREICMYAVLLSTVADLVLMNYVGVPKLLFRKANFVVGAIIFGIVQILYHICFLKIMDMKVLDNINGAGYFALFLGVLLVPSLIFIMSERSHVYIVSVLVYATCIMLNMVTIFNCAYMLGSNHILAAVGVFLFMVSDMFILIRENVKDSAFIRKLIWIFYPLGQLMIILGV